LDSANTQGNSEPFLNFISSVVVEASKDLLRLLKHLCAKSWKVISMPYINVQILEGATKEQKSKIVREMTQTLVSVLGKKPEHIHIVINEVSSENWGFAGMLTSDYLNQHP
jgi:4-oxalocrotonate tautomerase